ncbi:MAG: hypothetical protein AAB419_11380, partial [Pseudomonadota bacterium]
RVFCRRAKCAACIPDEAGFPVGGWCCDAARLPIAWMTPKRGDWFVPVAAFLFPGLAGEQGHVGSCVSIWRIAANLCSNLPQLGEYPLCWVAS